jgi:hypothetical protein
MKLSLKLFLTCFIVVPLFFNSSATHAQKLMAVSEGLSQNGDRFEVELKGGGTMFKYQYSSFRVASAKGGWTKNKYNSKLFSAYETATSEKKLSFIFVSDLGDSAIVNLNRNMKYEGFDDPGFTFGSENATFTIGGYQEVLENSDNLFGIIETNMADSIWNFVISSKSGTKIEENESLKGWLTNGNRKIDILPVFHYGQPGKKNMVDMMLGSEIWLKGFEFIENGNSVGAVQIGPIKNLFVVWFSKLNDPMTNFVIGSSFAALMHEYQMDISGGNEN